MSYRKRHIKSKINKTRPKKRFFQKLWFWVLVLILILVFSAVYIFLFYPGLQIKNIVISGNQKVGTVELRSLILNNAKTGLINFGFVDIFTKSIFLSDSGKIQKEILSKYPEIKEVNIKKNLPQTLIVSINERKPVAVYCGSQRCFLIDENGVVFEPADIVPEGFYIVRQSSDNGNADVGEDVVQKNVMDVIAKASKSLQDNFKINVAEAFVTNPLRLDIKTSENWKIYFDLDPSADINQQIVKLNLLLKEGTVESRQSLRYIDLRPKDRAIICDNSVCGN